MAATRQATGNSKPRVVEKIEASAPAAKKRAAPKKAVSKTKAKANTSAPRSKVSADKVTKKTAPTKKAPAKKAPAKKAAVKKTPAKKTPAKKVVDSAKKAATPGTSAAKAEPKHEPTVLDTLNGVLLKAQGLVTGSSGKKAAGTAKIRGTDNKKPAK